MTVYLNDVTSQPVFSEEVTLNYLIENVSLGVAQMFFFLICFILLLSLRASFPTDWAKSMIDGYILVSE